MEPKVICGFPGIGKSAFVSRAAAGVPVLDSDSSTFDKSRFPENYVEHIRESLQAGKSILASTHAEVRQALADACVPYTIVCPSSHAQKAEYIARYRHRGSPPAFIDLMDRMFDGFLASCFSDRDAEDIYLLYPGEFMSDVAYELLGVSVRI
ncbi:hypothetical protein H1O16_gp427 [Burkholderia phage BcepSaruman]|uniref:Uncharacterized protein n=1 Tax=Burkholderia phage BcepSaruman TaxID=2530032 RepID=A0A4D5ZDQ1_9CAUD|nr:hypothetical protein H1O16_gp427 [Burkholderia phage BcepSaruman]QBX06840.1 hypothetical protein BcepSaruman_427 [Burkholderia phage BcepSaruman]